MFLETENGSYDRFDCFYFSLNNIISAIKKNPPFLSAPVNSVNQFSLRYSITCYKIYTTYTQCNLNKNMCAYICRNFRLVDGIIVKDKIDLDA